jgi:hypothetical protein
VPRRKYGDPVGLRVRFEGPVFESYGWGMVPVRVVLGDSEWETALWPREGGYVVPVKDWVREAEGVDLGQVVELRLDVVARA